MNKKLFIGVIAIGASSAVFASGDITSSPTITLTPTPTNYFEGPYVGIGVGSMYTTAKVNETYNYQVTNDTSPEILLENTDSNSYHLNAWDFVGNIFAGYGKTVDSLYIGGELFARYTPYSESYSKESSFSNQIASNSTINLNSSISDKLENNYSLGGDLRFGYLITPRIMVYVLAGVDFTEFKYTTNNSGNVNMEIKRGDTVINTYDLGSYNTGDDTAEWQAAFMSGAGIEAMITNNLSLRLQYTYSFYNDMSTAHNFSTSSTISSLNQTTYTTSVASDDDIDLGRNVITLDLSYHFNGI